MGSLLALYIYIIAPQISLYFIVKVIVCTTHLDNYIFSWSGMLGEIFEVYNYDQISIYI